MYGAGNGMEAIGLHTSALSSPLAKYAQLRSHLISQLDWLSAGENAANCSAKLHGGAPPPISGDHGTNVETPET
jgi:hypothetical protein